MDVTGDLDILTLQILHDRPEDILRVHLTPRQAAFVANTERYNCFTDGASAGKTYAGVIKTLKLAVEQPGCSCLVLTPNYPSLKNIALRYFMDITPKSFIKIFDAPNTALDLVNHSRIYFRHVGSIDLMRGMVFHGVWLDMSEASTYLTWKWACSRIRSREYGGRGNQAFYTGLVSWTRP